MRHDRHATDAMDARDRFGECGEHLDLVFDPEGEQVTGPRRDLDARHDLHRTRAACRDITQQEGAADVVVIGERDDVEAGALRGVEDRLRRGEPIA